MEKLHSGHRERLRNRFLKSGLDGFAPHNILELLLFYSIARADTNELAHRLIKRFGSFSAVLDAPFEELLKIKGVGRNTAVLLKLIPQISRTYNEDKAGARKIISGEKAASEYLIPKFIGRQNEVFYLVCLDTQNRILFSDILFEGTVDASSVSMRRIVEACVQCGASCVIMAHNHPTGLALPSPEDIHVTRHVNKVLKSMGIRLLDHIIVAGESYLSLADSGVLIDL